MTKRETNALRLLRCLSDGEWHTSLDLVQHAGIRANGRLWDLRQKYHINVEKRSTGEDLYEYRWVDDAATKARVLALVVRGATPAPVEPKQLELV